MSKQCKRYYFVWDVIENDLPNLTDNVKVILSKSKIEGLQ